MERPAFLRLMAATTLVSTVRTPAAAEGNTIFEVALNGRDFSTLVAAVRYAGLVELLMSKGPYTLFAPTDAAFAKLPPGTMEAYLARPDMRNRLRDILSYHVVSGSLLSSQLQTGNLHTLDGPDLHVTAGPPIKINDATLIFNDVTASNGMVQVIDTVLTPPR
jgi:uncharacterized surface protein with fasciclin (FAS1) repeats